ncbi:hypothetical protein CLOSTMETH_01112 [[Clostridium] methylpentosum DSM 5476]|jgi:uncharacterized protein|uniref:Probable membrane transporter protein n=1 Tax=[Clostridium] methylpentosum DSM 5476 TaxID=537013 RepID=C0EB94_9FIRM|nr:hypothetical protein CLOSTMETH_01112 [[Clostridium] methylpentosum DSM 5476]MDY3988066.1 sulfite exporter TauE/SafE family protein [Massilioclostridium sp.]MEE1492062.1 sulfite exporter TauE/SafE family protein [Massilioclostridium sp.]
MNWLVVGLVGFLSGLTASLGLGGGFVLLIYLTAIANVDQMQAQGMNLLFFLPIAALSLWLHAKNGLVDKAPLWPAVLTGIAGAVAGAFIAFGIQTHWLSKLFAVFILIIGVKELFFQKKEKTDTAEHRDSPAE